MGGREGNPDPALKSFVTGGIRSICGGRNGVIFAAPPSAFSFYPHPCEDKKNVGTILSEMNLLRS